MRVSKALRWAVFVRDGMCVLAKLEAGHECRDVWGQKHAANDTDRLTLEHVHDGGGMMGKRAPDDLEHLVALCGYENNRPPSKAHRALFREYLSTVCNPHDSHVDPCGPDCRAAVPA